MEDLQRKLSLSTLWVLSKKLSNILCHILFYTSMLQSTALAILKSGRNVFLT